MKEVQSTKTKQEKKNPQQKFKYKITTERASFRTSLQPLLDLEVARLGLKGDMVPVTGLLGDFGK